MSERHKPLLLGQDLRFGDVGIGDNNLEVVVQVDGSCSNYFERQKMLPDQEIKEERPEDFRKSLIKDMKQ